MGNFNALGVIGNGHKPQTHLFSRLGNLLNRKAPIAPVGVNVKVSANPIIGHNLRKLTLQGSLHLTPVLPQLRRYKLKPQHLINLFLPLSRNPLTTSNLKHAVLVYLKPLFLGYLPQVNVVLFRSGEVLKSSPPLVFLNHPEIHLSRTYKHAGLGGSLGYHLTYPIHLHKAIHYHTSIAYGQDVYVTHRLLHPPKGTGVLDPLTVGLKLRDHVLCQLQRFAQKHSIASLKIQLQPLLDVFHLLGSHTGKLGKRSVLYHPLQILKAPYPKPLVGKLQRLGSKIRHI